MIMSHYSSFLATRSTNEAYMYLVRAEDVAVCLFVCAFVVAAGSFQTTSKAWVRSHGVR